MTPTDKSNAELAEMYLLEIAGRRKPIQKCHRNVAKAICSSDINIARFYEKHRSLKDLRVPGIGGDTRRMLGLILSGDSEGMQIFLFKKETARRYSSLTPF